MKDGVGMVSSTPQILEGWGMDGQVGVIIRMDPVQRKG